MKLVAIDIETGGLDLHVHPITQIAAVAFEVERWSEEGEWREIATFERKVKFREELCDPEALKLRYRPEDWVDAISPFRANDELSQFLRDHSTVERLSKAGKPYRVAQLAGHNAAQFDVPFLRRWYERLTEEDRKTDPRSFRFFPASFHVLDTLQLALWRLGGRTGDGASAPKSYKLADLCAFLGVALPPEDAHDALADVRATAAIARALIQRQALAA